MICQQHSNDEILLINLDLNHPNLFLCMQCLLSSNHSPQQLVSLKQILEVNNVMITNWTPMANQTDFDKIKDLQAQEGQCLNELELVRREFVPFIENIVKDIEELKKKIIIRLNHINDLRNELLQEYEDKSLIQSVKQCLTNQHSSQQEIEKELRVIIKSLQDNSNSIQRDIKDKMEILQSFKDTYNLGIIKKMMSEMRETLSELSFLKPHDNFQTQIEQIFERKQENSQQQQQQQELQQLQMNDELDQKVKTIMSLVDTKANYCNEQFISGLQTLFRQNKHIFQDLDFSEIHQFEQCQIDFENFNSTQMEWIKQLHTLNQQNQQLRQQQSFRESLLSQNNLQLQQQYSNQSQQQDEINLFQSLLLQQQQVSTSTQINQQNTTFNIDYSAYLIMSKLSELSRKFGEEMSQISFNKIGKIQLLDEIEIIRKAIKDDQQNQYAINIVKSPIGIEIQNNIKDKIWRQVYISHQINFGDKYQIIVELSLKDNEDNDNMCFGVLPESSLDKYVWNSGHTLFTGVKNPIYGFDQVVSGQHISLIRKWVTSLTFQICLKEKIMRCSTIVGNRHLYQQSNIQCIEEDKYYFGIALFRKQAKVTLKEFSIVNQFNEI